VSKKQWWVRLFIGCATVLFIGAGLVWWKVDGTVTTIYTGWQCTNPLIPGSKEFACAPIAEPGKSSEVEALADAKRFQDVDQEVACYVHADTKIMILDVGPLTTTVIALDTPSISAGGATSNCTGEVPTWWLYAHWLTSPATK
jgi:hypothetical protein